MNREHIFNLAISIDEDAIAQKAIDYCAREVTKGLGDGYFERGRYGKSALSYKMVAVIEKQSKDFTEQHKEEIIEAVIARVTEKVFRSKALREKLIGSGERWDGFPSMIDSQRKAEVISSAQSGVGL